MSTSRGRAITWLLVTAVVVGGCAPSMPYQTGTGYYSDVVTRPELQVAGSAGKVKNLGPFTVEGWGCFNYTPGLTDSHAVLPAIREKLSALGANAADNVVVREKKIDLVLGALIVPALLGCNNWTITGDALYIERSSASLPGGLDRELAWARTGPASR